jgi:hypothetical protein
MAPLISPSRASSWRGFRVVDEGEKPKRRRDTQRSRSPVAKRQLHPLVVALALNTHPFLPKSATGQTDRK